MPGSINLNGAGGVYDASGANSIKPERKEEETNLFPSPKENLSNENMYLKKQDDVSVDQNKNPQPSQTQPVPGDSAQEAKSGDPTKVKIDKWGSGKNDNLWNIVKDKFGLTDQAKINAKIDEVVKYHNSIAQKDGEHRVITSKHRVFSDEEILLPPDNKGTNAKPAAENTKQYSSAQAQAKADYIVNDAKQTINKYDPDVIKDNIINDAKQTINKYDPDVIKDNIINDAKQTIDNAWKVQVGIPEIEK